MPFEVLWDSVLKMPFPCRTKGWSCTDCCCWAKQKHHMKWTSFSFLPWPPVKVESRVFQWGLSFCAIWKSVNTNGILSRFDVTVKKCFITRCEVVVVIQDIYFITGIAHLSIPVAMNVKRPVWMNIKAKSEASGSGHSRPWFLLPIRLPVPQLHTHSHSHSH